MTVSAAVVWRVQLWFPVAAAFHSVRVVAYLGGCVQLAVDITERLLSERYEAWHSRLLATCFRNR